MNRQDLEKCIAETYCIQPDYPWRRDPASAVFRHSSNQKWFALIMEVPKSRLGLCEEGILPIVNLKCSPILIGSLLHKKGFFPAYHMCKDSWISVALDGSVPAEELKLLLSMSFEFTSVKSGGRSKPRV